jgi:hypothetical protein
MDKRNGSGVSFWPLVIAVRVRESVSMCVCVFVRVYIHTCMHTYIHKHSGGAVQDETFVHTPHTHTYIHTHTHSGGAVQGRAARETGRSMGE